MTFANIFKNKVFIYVSSRYATYFFQFVIGFTIAAKLGPFYFGIYGFIQLIINYFGNINLGINHSLNIYLVHYKDNKTESTNYIINSLVITFLLSVAVSLICLFMAFSPIEAFEKYHIDEFLPIIGIVAILQYFNNVFVTVLRIKNRLNCISLIQSIQIIPELLCIVLFTGEALIWALCCCLTISGIVGFICTRYTNSLPNIKDSTINKKYIINLLRKGFYLFLYNSGFAFVVISNRTMVSHFYEVESFGLFSFAYQLANALISLSAAMSFVIMPKLLDRLSSDDFDVVKSTIDVVNKVYVSFTHFIVYLAMPFFYVLLLVLPQYSGALTAMNLISLAVLLNTHTITYSSLLIAQNEERKCAAISLFGLLLNVVVGVSMIMLFEIQFSYVIIATMFTYAIVCLLMAYFGNRKIRVYSIMSAISSVFPCRLVIPFLVAFILSFAKVECIMFLPLVTYVILNHGNLKSIFDNYIKKLISSPQMVDLK